jgi:CheY-like chemotaxis protein
MKDRPPRSFHLVLTDMDMPSMGGAAAVGALRKLESDVPVILMSGLAPALDSPEVKRLGIEGVIEKPFRAEELLTLVRGVLDAHPVRGVTVS